MTVHFNRISITILWSSFGLLSILFHSTRHVQSSESKKYWQFQYSSFPWCSLRLRKWIFSPCLLILIYLSYVSKFIVSKKDTAFFKMVCKIMLLLRNLSCFSLLLKVYIMVYFFLECFDSWWWRWFYFIQLSPAGSSTLKCRCCCVKGKTFLLLSSMLKVKKKEKSLFNYKKKERKIYLIMRLLLKARNFISYIHTFVVRNFF